MYYSVRLWRYPTCWWNLLLCATNGSMPVECNVWICQNSWIELDNCNGATMLMSLRPGKQSPPFPLSHRPEEEVFCSGCLRSPGTVVSELGPLLRCLVGTFTEQENGLQLQCAVWCPEELIICSECSGGQQMTQRFSRTSAGHAPSLALSSLCARDSQ